MKKFTVVLLALITLFAFTGCNGGSGTDSTKAIGSDDTSAAPAAAELSIQEQVCFEYDSLKVTALSVTDDTIWGTGIKLLLENNSAKDYSVSADAVIVNDCMITSLFSCKVAAGKKANDVLYLSSSELKAAGIENIGQIEVYFKVLDSSTYETVYNADCVTVKTSQFDIMDKTADDSGTELYNQGGIRIVGKYVDEDTFWGSSVLLYIENSTDVPVTVSCDDLSVNGFMQSALFSSTVYAGKYELSDITLLSSSLEENNITSIDTIELKFHIYNHDTYDTIADTDAITFSAK